MVIDWLEIDKVEDEVQVDPSQDKGQDQEQKPYSNLI